MRNVFDQYTQPENRLTHALACCLNEDHRLLSRFVKWQTGVQPPKRLFIVEQQLPGEEEISELQLDRRGLPDAWIHDNEEWCLLIESKVSAALSIDQLERHYKTAVNRGYETIVIIALDISPDTQNLPQYARYLSWKELYSWMTAQAQESNWANRFIRYLEVAESKMASEGYLREGTLTEFNGIHFERENPYNYSEGKRLIKLIMEALRQHPKLLCEIPIDPDAPGRGAITGSRGTGVWDYLWIAGLYDGSKSTLVPHLTLGLNQEVMNVQLMLPSSLKSEYRNPIKKIGNAEFFSLMEAIHENMKPLLRQLPTATPFFSANQRWFASQRAKPTINATMKMDLRTAIKHNGSTVKYQPQWLSAGYELLCNKKSNLEFAIGVTIPYEGNNIVQTKGVIDLIADCWIATKPVLDVMLDS